MYENIKRIYTAGKMTGVEDFNFPAFFELQYALEAAGYEVENPANNDGDCLEIALYNAQHASKGTWEDYMAIDIPRVISCDAVVVLPGWRNSPGACWEVDIMRRLKRPVLRWDGVLKPLVSVIGFSGYAGSGKDTAAALLKPYGFDRRAFADILRNCLYALDPTIEIVKDFYEDSFNDYYKLGRLKDRVDRQGWQEAKIDSLEIRTLLQKMGTEVGRNILGENIWVDTVMKSLEDGHNYVFTDCRFPNEAAAVKQYGGKMIRINRPGFKPINNHPSETSLDDYEFDTIIENDGDLENFKNQLLLAVNDKK